MQSVQIQIRVHSVQCSHLNDQWQENCNGVFRRKLFQFLLENVDVCWRFVATVDWYSITAVSSIKYQFICDLTSGNFTYGCDVISAFGLGSLHWQMCWYSLSWYTGFDVMRWLICCMQTVEDIFKVTLSTVAADTSSGKKPAMPDLNAVRSLTNTATLYWSH